MGVGGSGGTGSACACTEVANNALASIHAISLLDNCDNGLLIIALKFVALSIINKHHKNKSVIAV